MYSVSPFGSCSVLSPLLLLRCVNPRPVVALGRFVSDPISGGFDIPGVAVARPLDRDVVPGPVCPGPIQLPLGNVLMPRHTPCAAVMTSVKRFACTGGILSVNCPG